MDEDRRRLAEPYAGGLGGAFLDPHVSALVEPLNEAQREAVIAPPGHTLVLAGAGSGKTRVLTHRIAWLIRAEGVSPFNILAVTFTNKAANEMRGRIASLLNHSVQGMWIGTFHGLCHRFLRLHWQTAELPRDFQILDSEDQLRLLKRVMKGLEVDDAKWKPQQVQWFINARKDEGLRPHHLSAQDPFTARMISIYQAYENACRRSGLVDFPELLLRTFETLQRDNALLEHYRERFAHILVDEFQDTNALQYHWLKLLAGKRGKLFAVGDDDQSIYGWRGARVENILRLREDLPGIQVIRLEQNYRSTATILKAANAVIRRNQNRLGKELWTAGEEGGPIRIYTAIDEVDEARFVVERIKAWPGRLGDIAVLYRSNAQSRAFEEQLFTQAIPYRVHGGLRFFERAEVKDALAYLRLIANRADDASFERVVNFPTRGIGERTLEKVREVARERDLSLWEASRAIIEEKGLPSRVRYALGDFLALIENLSQAGQVLSQQVDEVIRQSGLLAHYQKEKGEKGRARVENLKELITAVRAFEGVEEEGLTPLSSFLAHAALEAGEAQGEPSEDCVQLMTLHAAKGLEFPVVFMAGMEEGLFPSRQSVGEAGKLEEERRLCYVGMTRAQKLLYLTHAERRRLYGTEYYPRPSRFLQEIPEEHLESVRLAGVIQRPKASDTETQAVPGLYPGQRVRHPKFGMGTVLAFRGEGARAQVEVNFRRAGRKWLMVSYANLEVS